MKKIENKKISTKVLIDLNDESKGTKEARYSDLIILAMKSPRQEGFNYDAMSSTKRVVDACDKHSEKDELIMEDADMDYMKAIVEPFNWKGYNEDIIQMTIAIRNAKTAK